MRYAGSVFTLPPFQQKCRRAHVCHTDLFKSQIRLRQGPASGQHRISDAVAGRNWRTLRRLWILLQRHRGSHRQEREVKSKELLNFTIISDYLLQDLILAKQRGHGRLDDGPLTSHGQTPSSSASRLCPRESKLSLRRTCGTGPSRHPSKRHPFGCYCLFFKKKKPRLRMVK